MASAVASDGRATESGILQQALLDDSQECNHAALSVVCIASNYRIKAALARFSVGSKIDPASTTFSIFERLIFMVAWMSGVTRTTYRWVPETDTPMLVSEGPRIVKRHFIS